jgi:hypothetical protein
MVFGDVVQTASGGIANTRVISNVQAGNTLLLFGIFRSFEGSEPTSVTDDVNAGSYAEIFDYGNASTNEPQISCYMLANTAAGATTVTTTGTTPFRWGLVEVKGVLVNSGVGTGNVVTANTNTVTAAAAVVPNNSVSFAGIDTQRTNANLTPTQAGWEERVDFNSLEVKRQFVTTSASLNISGTKDDQASGYAVGWAAFTQAVTGPSEAYVLTAHGTPQANSMMEGNQFATTGPVYFDITGGDTNIANPDWPSINAAQLWLTNINDIAAFNPVAAGSVTYTVSYRVAEDSSTGSFTRTVNVSEPATVVPQGTWTIGTITKGQTTASFTPTYSGTDATSYQYSIGGGAYTAFTGTISLTGLSAEVAYSGLVRAVNAAGNGATQAFSFTTDAVAEEPPAFLPVVRGIGRKVGLRSAASVSLRSSINSSIH